MQSLKAVAEPMKPALGQSLAPARHQGLSWTGLPASLGPKDCWIRGFQEAEALRFVEIVEWQGMCRIVYLIVVIWYIYMIIYDMPL